MGSKLPSLSKESFLAKIEEVAPEGLEAESQESLWCHYEELIRWNTKVSLVGPGTGDDLVARHYGESLAALALLDDKKSCLLDIGSGGGFPGFVLAAARRKLDVTLVEPRQKKWAFLTTTARKAGLSCRTVSARVGDPLPAPLVRSAPFDIVTSRALVISAEIFQAIARHSPRARFLLWRGREDFEPPTGYVRGRYLGLPTGGHRHLLEIVPRQ